MLVLCAILPGALLVLWFLRHQHSAGLRSAFLNAALVWGVAAVGIPELLSLGTALTPGLIAAAWTLVALVAGAALFCSRGPRPGPRTGPPPRAVEIAIGLPIAAVLATTAFVAAVGWPNQWDSMVYHLPRIQHWLQDRTIAFYPTHIVRQLYNPPWAEFAALQLTALASDERWANAPQWFSLLGSLAGVSLIAGHLGVGRTGQLMSALFCATIPMGVLQASGNQNDYVAAFWLVCLAEAVLSPPGPNPLPRGLRIGASLGLAVLTKGTAYLFAPPLLLVWLLGARLPAADRVRAAALALLVALALNLPHFLRNVDTFDSPLGPRNLGSASGVGDSLTNDEVSTAILASNLLRNIALHFATSRRALNAPLESALEAVHRHLGIDVGDPRTTRTYPESSFRLFSGSADPSRTGNPVHLLALLGSISAIVAARRLGTRPGAGALALALVAGFVVFSLVLKWQPWHSRLQLPLFVLGSPLFGLAGEAWPKAAAAAAVLMSLLLSRPLVRNEHHPLMGERSVLRTSRLQQYYGERSEEDAMGRLAEHRDAAAFVRSRACNRAGLALGWDDWEHPWWVLLPGVQLEHVGVTNRSARLEEGRPEFVPCAVLGTRRDVETLEVRGRAYRRAWAGTATAVFLPARTPEG